jgi:hypothetical protein
MHVPSLFRGANRSGVEASVTVMPHRCADHLLATVILTEAHLELQIRGQAPVLTPGGYRDVSEGISRVPRLVFFGRIQGTIHYIWYSAMFSLLNVGPLRLGQTLMVDEPRVSLAKNF